MRKLEQDWLELVQQQRAIAVIRAPQIFLAQEMAKAVAAGGICLIEITWNTEGAANLISQLRSELPTCRIGTGTLVDVQQTREAIAAGAQFLFSPHTNSALIEVAVNADIPIIPGALSPTEIVTAWQAGASSVKVFPVQAMGGASYIQSLQGPLGKIPLIPTGGVTVSNAASFVQAGAVAVGLAGDLFPQLALAKQDWTMVAQQARKLVQALQNSA